MKYMFLLYGPDLPEPGTPQAAKVMADWAVARLGQIGTVEQEHVLHDQLPSAFADRRSQPVFPHSRPANPRFDRYGAIGRSAPAPTTVRGRRKANHMDSERT